MRQASVGGTQSSCFKQLLMKNFMVLVVASHQNGGMFVLTSRRFGVHERHFLALGQQPQKGQGATTVCSFCTSDQGLRAAKQMLDCWLQVYISGYKCCLESGTVKRTSLFVEENVFKFNKGEAGLMVQILILCF